MAASITEFLCNIRVSSVLNRDTRQFGKKHLTDGDEETCWNSDQGTPQWIMMEFPDPCRLEELNLQFQGGFVGKECSLEAEVDDKFTQIMNFYPEDSNKPQKFSISQPVTARRFKIVFSSSTDFYGRITIYNMDVIGRKV